MFIAYYLFINSLQTQQNSVELLKSSLENDQQQLVKLEEAENNWKMQHRMDLSNIKSEHQLIQGRNVGSIQGVQLLKANT